MNAQNTVDARHDGKHIRFTYNEQGTYVGVHCIHTYVYMHSVFDHYNIECLCTHTVYTLFITSEALT